MFINAAFRCPPLLVIALIGLAAAGCSPAPETPSPPNPAVAPVAAAPATPAASAPQSAQPAPGSRIISKADTVLRDSQPVCEIVFAYAGHQPENIFWEEPCSDVTVAFIDQAELEAMNDWERLDSFDRQFINALPEGRVLYVGGEFTATIYPIGGDLKTYEIMIAD